jgi:hypothetical protein
LLGIFLDPENGGDIFLRSVGNKLHGVISQKVELFITTGVTTSNPTDFNAVDINIKKT